MGTYHADMLEGGVQPHDNDSQQNIGEVTSKNPLSKAFYIWDNTLAS